MEEYIEHQVKNKVEKFVKSAVKVLFIMILVAVFILLFGYVFMWLWNWLMPDIFGLTTVNYWQAVGILVLAKLIFGGFEGRGPKGGSKKSKRRCRPGRMTGLRKDFSKWQHYDQFWKEEGEQAYNEYVAKKANKGDNPSNDS